MTLAASYRSVRTRLSPHFEIAADVVHLARLIPPGDQAQIGADISRSANAAGIVDCGDKSESGQLADAWNRHQPAASCRGPCHAPYVGVDRGDRTHHRSPRRNQSPHGDRETGDPLACSKSVVDEGGGERAGQSDPEHDRETTDLIF